MTSRPFPAFWASVCIALGTFGCGDEDDADDLPPLAIAEGCNPLAADRDCSLPYPSDFFAATDPSTASGRRVSFDTAAQLLTKDDTRVDLSALHVADGFSPGNQIMALFPEGVDDSGLTFHTDDVGATLSASSRTILLDADTGEPVLHFAELDPRAETDERRALLIRPLVRLADGHRYIVALHDLLDKQGQPLKAPEGFRRIRDRRSSGDPVLEPMRKRFEKDVFPALAAFGVTRSELTLAWDFTVRSEPNVTEDMVAVREQTLAWLATESPVVEVVSVTDDPEDYIGRRLELNVTVPLFLDQDAPYGKLVRSSAGSVIQNGFTTAQVSVLVPKSVTSRAPGTPPARLMQYGHGFFGSREEAAGPPSRIANEKGFVVAATNWVGMCEEDRFQVVEKIVTDTDNALLFTDRAHQAMANAIVVGAALQGDLAHTTELQFAGEPAYDPTTLYFYGNSMGHILGGTYLALTPTIERAVLGVGGANLSYITFRARPLNAFMLFVANVFPDALDQQKFVAQIQLSFDRIDPLTYAPRVTKDTLPGSPETRRVLLQIGLGDSEVNPLAGELHARALGASLLEPSPRTVAGLAPVNSPFEGSALALYDFGVEPFPGLYATPPETGTDAHEGLRELSAAKEQLDRFLRPDGKIEHTCSGVCDPE